MEISQLQCVHEEHHGVQPTVIAFAPGRINLIGEHTDYNGGFVMPAAIDRGIWVTASITDGPTSLWSSVTGDGATFDAPTVERQTVDGWASYAAGMAWVLRDQLGPCPNIVGTVHSNLPMGSGVSSSAAMEMVFGHIWAALVGVTIEPKHLALLGQKCENKFVGVNCGVMDQMASSCGREGSAVFIDTRSLDIQLAPVPKDLSIVLCDTKKPRALTDSAYNERRSQCEAASSALGVTELRDADLDMLLAAKTELDPIVFRRAKHVITENARTLEFQNALANNDRDAIQALLRGSHTSLRDDYEVSCLELDVMAEAASTSPGCVGARMTGAGFGGACVALVETQWVIEFRESASAAYKAKTGIDPEIMACKPVQGAHLLWQNR